MGKEEDTKLGPGLDRDPLLDKQEVSAVASNDGVIKLVICDHAREDCEGCTHAEAHEPETNMKQEVCTDIDRCAFHDVRVQCKEVL